MSNRLLEILAHKRTEIDQLDLADEKAQAQDAPAPRDFAGALTGQGTVRLIAEIKKASPSRGVLAPGLEVTDIARLYVDHGAACISVLTDERFFLGHLDHLRALRFEPAVPVPVLRKDFMLAPVQVYQARAAGADAILLIVAALEDGMLHELHAQAQALGMTVLVEVHDAEEVEHALRIPDVRLIGINNRDLRTFEVRRQTALELRRHIPSGILTVSESGIFTAEHVAEVRAAGLNAILVGEALVTAGDIGAKVRELVG